MNKNKGIIFAVLFVFVLLSSLSILRYVSYNAAILDLGYMSQAIWSASNGDMLLVSYPQGILSRFTGHSEVIYFLVALLYKNFPDPRTLLIVQAFLYVSGALPLYFLALDKLKEQKYALWISLIYLLYPVAMTAALFDFHGDTLAMPLFFFAFYFLEKKRLFPYSIFLLLILTCKIYIILPVMVLGVVLLLKKKTRAGLLTILICIIWYCSVYLIRNQIFGGGAVESASAQAVGYASSYFSDVLLVIWEDFDYRVINGIIVLLPIVFLGRHAPLWLLPGLGLAGGVLLSSGPGPGYDYRFHHYAAAVPFFVVAVLEGAYNTSQGNTKKIFPTIFSKSRSWKTDLKTTLILVCAMNFLLVQTPLSPQFYLIPYRGSNEIPALSYTWRDKLKDKITTEIIPPNKGVMADIFLAPHMANRSYLYSTYYTDTDGDGSVSQSQQDRIFSEVEYIVIDIFSVYFNIDSFTEILNSGDYHLVFNVDGLLVFSKESTNPPISSFRIIETNVSDCIKNLDDHIQLCEVETNLQQNNSYLFRYKWANISGEVLQNNLIAVTRFVGPNQVAFIHIPTLEAIANQQWGDEQILEETLCVEFPDLIQNGNYQIYTAWYDISNPGFTDLKPEARINDEVYLGSITIEQNR